MQRVDVVVVGAGIVGLGHAVAALDAGLRTLVLDRDDRAVGASVRNFGHLGASVQSGELAVLARDSQPLWQRLARDAGVPLVEAGTLVVARNEAEAAAVEALGERGDTRLLDARETAAELGRDSDAPGAPVRSALIAGDFRTDPRTACARMAAFVDAHPLGEIRFQSAVTHVEPGIVHTNDGAIEAAHIVVATGHHLRRLVPNADPELRECALQMVRVDVGERAIRPAVLTGTSMLRYGAFASLPGMREVREAIENERPGLLAIDANVMFTQAPDGTLIVGDSHVTAATASPFMPEATTGLLLDEVAAVLGTPLRVVERWQGVYAVSPTQDVLIHEPAEGVVAVAVTTGVGMTTGLGIGARTIERIADG